MKVVSKGSFLELQRFTKLYANKWFLLVVFLLSVVILLLPSILRDTPFSIGDESFYHLRISKDILINGGVNYDALSFSGRSNFMETGLGHTIAGVSFITKMSIEESAKSLFLFLGLASLLILYLILKLHGIEKSFLMLPILIFSPAFIYLFTVVNKFAIPVFLTLLLIYFLLKKRFLISLIFFLMLPIFDLSYSIFVFVSIVLFYLYTRKKKLGLFASFLVTLGVLFYATNANLNLISDFGGEIGLSIFGLFIILFGLGSLWKKKGFAQFYFLFFILFLISLKLFWVVFLLNIVFCLLIAFNLDNLLRSNWDSVLIKELTILLLVCGLLFSGLSSIKSLSEEEPNEDIFNALAILPRESVVLSHHSNGHWISYAGMKNIMDGFMEFEGIDKRKRDVDKLFGSRDFNDVIGLLNEYDVDYILITPEMRNGLVWNENEEGLLFLLKYSEKFDNIKEGNIGVWEYKR